LSPGRGFSFLWPAQLDASVGQHRRTKEKGAIAEYLLKNALHLAAVKGIIIYKANDKLNWRLRGEMAEWSKALAWRASRWATNLSRGFESLSLRQTFLKSWPC
jgi:hypothetical protein